MFCVAPLSSTIVMKQNCSVNNSILIDSMDAGGGGLPCRMGVWA